jgi:hypothetical protein
MPLTTAGLLQPSNTRQGGKESCVKLLEVICRALLRVFTCDCYWLW